MMYVVEYSRHAEKFLTELRDLALGERILSAVRQLSQTPRPVGCVKLSGTSNQYRIRVGNYRVIYSVEDRRVRVLVLAIGHRREIYR